jgi:hypothetical protein
VVPRGQLLRTPPTPGGHGGECRSAFETGPGQRPLRVLVDRRTAETPGYDFLIKLCSHSGVHAVSEAAAALDRLEFQQPDRDEDQLPFTIISADKATGLAIWPYSKWEKKARVLNQSVVPDGLPHGFRLAAVAQEIKMDALATEDPLLLAHRTDHFLSRGNIRSVEEAVALVGLFLRSRGDYTVWPEYSFHYGRGSYYWGLARALLPAGWRWFSACVTSSSNGGPDKALTLGQAAIRRVERALRCRDVVHIELAKPDSRDAAGEALFYLDSLLVALSGAFDSVARVAHVTYEMPGQLRWASWRNREWLKQLRDADNDLAARMVSGTDGGDSLELVAALRNCLHGEPLDLVTVSRGYEGRTLVTVPDEEAAKVRSIVQRHPPADSFGIEDLSFGLAFKPEILCEALVPWAVRTLDALMAATDVTRLPGVAGTVLRAGPPNDERPGFPGLFQPETRHRLRMLAGL